MKISSFADSAVMALKTEECLALLDLVALILATTEQQQEIALPEQVQGCLEELEAVLQTIKDQSQQSASDRW